MIPLIIELTGRVYIKYIDLIEKPAIGDVQLLLNDDAVSSLKGDYESLKASGYIKAKVYDGLVWQNFNISELCVNKEYKFVKRQKALDSALLCTDIITQCRGVIMHKTYRGHFTANQ
jgi:hypothetical protein